MTWQGITIQTDYGATGFETNQTPFRARKGSDSACRVRPPSSR